MFRKLWDLYLEVEVMQTTWSLIKKMTWFQKFRVLVPFLCALLILALLLRPTDDLRTFLVVYISLNIVLLVSLWDATKLIEAKKSYEDRFSEEKGHRSERYGKFASQLAKFNFKTQLIERTIRVCDTQRELAFMNSFDLRSLVDRSYKGLAFLVSSAIAILGLTVAYAAPFVSQQPEDVQQSYIETVGTVVSIAARSGLVLILYFIIAEFLVSIIFMFGSRREKLLEFKLFLEMYLLEQPQEDQHPGWR